jgi:hypothetical protein
MHWYGNDIDTSIRGFLKVINNVKPKINFLKLRRFGTLGLDFDFKDCQLDWSKELLSLPYLKKNERQDNNDGIKYRKNFVNMKIDKEKSFKIKKFVNELPVMEVQKLRFPKLYKENYMCPRCGVKKETLEHLWNCSKADNEVLDIQSRIKERFRKLVLRSNNFDVDSMMVELFPFFKIKKNLRRFTKESSKFYVDLGGKKSRRMEYTYIWDGVNSLDNIMMGFLPGKMIDIMFKYQKRKSSNEVKKILLSWANKLNSLIFEKLWKIRNDLMIEWEISVNITNKLKKRSILKKKPNKNSYKKQRDGLPNPSSNRERLKRGIRVGKQSTVHLIDELTYRAIKLDVGLNDFDFTL